LPGGKKFLKFPLDKGHFITGRKCVWEKTQAGGYIGIPDGFAAGV
jgi:hypothetical protein